MDLGLPISLSHIWNIVATCAVFCFMKSVCRDVEDNLMNNRPPTDDVDYMIQSQLTVDPYTHHKLPVLKMLKRQIKDFRSLRNATLTLVYHSKEPVTAHWFKTEYIGGDQTIYPILEDDPHYSIKYMHSGDVTAATFTIPPQYQEDNYIIDTILTPPNATIQYQIQSILDREISYFVENIDSPEWLVIPPTKEHLNKDDSFERHYRSYVRPQKGMNALILMQASPIDGVEEKHPEFQIVAQTHDQGMKVLKEETGSMIMKGTFSKMLKVPKAVLDLEVTQLPAEESRLGLYMCSVERHLDDSSLLDRLSLLSFVTYDNVIGLIPGKPIVEIMTCSVTNKAVDHNGLYFTEGMPGCVRCRGFSDPAPEVDMFKVFPDGRTSYTEISKQVSSVSVTKFVNVAEGGVVEAIYVFRNPEHRRSGTYLCRAKNHLGIEEREVQIQIDRQRRF